MKITFKKDPSETGLSGIGRPYPNTNIKESKKVVGYIAAPAWNTKTKKWVVRIAVKRKITEKDPAPFRWVSFAKKFDTEPLARIAIKANLENALAKLGAELHHFED